MWVVVVSHQSGYTPLVIGPFGSRSNAQAWGYDQDWQWSKDQNWRVTQIYTPMSMYREYKPTARQAR